MIRQLCEFLFPPLCPGCGKAMRHEGDWCKSCFDEVAFSHEITGCPSNAIDSVWTLSRYDGGMKRLMHDVKFNKKKERARGAAPFFASFDNAIFRKNLLSEVVVPIPISDKRRKERGYNQVDLLFKPAIDRLASQDRGYWKWLNALVKVDSTKPMWGLTKTERSDNMRGAFLPVAAVRRSHILENTTVLLVDDIYTTGATVSEAAEVLKRLGCQRIKVLTLASGR